MMMTISDIITRYHLTQSGLARELGIPLRTVQGWALGERTPPEWTVRLIAEHYAVAQSTGAEKSESDKKP